MRGRRYGNPSNSNCEEDDQMLGSVIKYCIKYDEDTYSNIVLVNMADKAPAQAAVKIIIQEVERYSAIHDENDKTPLSYLVWCLP